MLPYIESKLGFLYHPILHSIRTKKAYFYRFLPATNYIDKTRKEPCLFLDITRFYNRDEGTGIHRCVREFNKYVSMWSKYKIVYIFAKEHMGFYNCDTKEKIKIIKGDVYFHLDNIDFVSFSNRRFLKTYHKHGLKVFNFLHDLIPVRYPETVGDRKLIRLFSNVVKEYVKYDGVIANSKFVIDDLKSYLKENPSIKVNKKLRLEYAHLGSDFCQKESINFANEIPEFLMVSTVEPRKKYDQAVLAFTDLWDKGYKIKLNIVGRPGWLVEDTIKLINNNKYLNKFLFWYNTGIPDDELCSLYQRADAVVFASISEGYGLALAEAASYNKPLIIRDIPVFRELVNDTALYFTGLEPDAISNKILEFLEMRKNKNVLLPVVKYTSWEDFTKKILSYMDILNEKK